AAIPELCGGDVNGEVYLPVPRMGTGGHQHITAKIADEAAFLGNLDEDIGRNGAVDGVRPARQRLDADDPSVARLDDRLERHGYLARRDRHVEIMLDLLAEIAAVVELLVIGAQAILAARL